VTNLINKEHLALSNNFRVTKKFLIVKFNCTVFFIGGHSTTTWTKFYPILTPSSLEWTIVDILHDT
jgi:hypothetical protein